MDDGFIWNDAEVSYPDWKGTAQLDQRKTALGIEEAVGLGDDWLIVGFDIGGGERAHYLKVVAVRKDTLPEGGDVFPKIAAANGGEIPVTEFLIHDVDPYVVLKAITHGFELKMRRRGSRNLPIRVVDRSDVPEQD